MTDLLFPMGIKSLMHQLEDIVRRWYQLGMELGLPTGKLEEIEVNNPGNVLRCKRLILQEWERRPTPPSWPPLLDRTQNTHIHDLVKIMLMAKTLTLHNAYRNKSGRTMKFHLYNTQLAS